MTRRTLVLSLAAVAVAGLAWLAAAAPLAWLAGTVAGLGPLAPVAFVALAALLLALLVPRTPVSLACGLLFGAATGTVCAVAVALLAGAVTFILGRRFGPQLSHWGESWSGRWGGRRWRRTVRLRDGDATLAVAAVRALPIGPYGLVGYAFGASTVRTRHYALGTTIAAIPSAVTNAVLGAAITGSIPRQPLALAPLALGLALSTVVLMRAMVLMRARRESGEQRVDQLAGAGQEG